MPEPEDTVARVKIALLAMQRHSWEQGTAMQALLEQGDREMVIAMAAEAVYRQIADGRAAIIGAVDAVTDPCSVGEALLYACGETGNPALKRGCDALLQWALHRAPRSKGGVLYHVESKPQFWSDSMYMLPPFLAAAGYYDEALVNLYGYWDALYDGEAKLMGHIWDDEKKVFVRGAHWGGGNGWTLAAFARIYDLLPDRYEEDRRRIAEMSRSLVDGVIAHIRPDGLFHDVVDDPATFVETNLSQMLAYTIYRAVRSKWLDGSFLSTAEKLYGAARKKIDAYGLVRDCCGAPSFDKPGVSPEGQAFYLLMEAAREKCKEAR
ncbi:MAG: glycoside hydrolase family 88 protein [Treponema sp.]|nr:glycoside hydrolase family 88 protein [Treponema sp.]